MVISVSHVERERALFMSKVARGAPVSSGRNPDFSEFQFRLEQIKIHDHILLNEPGPVPAGSSGQIRFYRNVKMVPLQP